MIVPPGRSRPSRSAASMSLSATRSLIDPPGLNDSTLATICGASPCPIRLSRISGVWPTVSRIESLMSCVVPVAAGGVIFPTIGRCAGLPPDLRKHANCARFRRVNGAGFAAVLLNAQEGTAERGHGGGSEREAGGGDGAAPRTGAAARGQPVLALPRRCAGRLPARPGDLPAPARVGGPGHRGRVDA